MKKLLGLLGTIMIAGNAIPSVIAAAPNRKHNIKKRQNNENTPTTPKTQDDQEFSDIIEKEITLNENYSNNIQKMLQELIKNNQLDPLRMINNEGILTTDYFETSQKQKEREENIKIIEKLEEILELRKFDAHKIRILVLILKNSNNESIKLVINLNNLYLLGFINNQNQYFYFDDEFLKRIEQINQEEITKLNNLKDKLNNLKENKLLFNEKKVQEYLQQKNELIPLKAKEKDNKKLNYNNELNSLNKKISNLQGENLKDSEEKIKTINSIVTKKYNCQNINLNYTGAYSEVGLNVVIKEENKTTRRKDIVISQETLNNAIENLSILNNENKQNQTTKDDLARMIFITSEFVRFGSYLQYFDYEKNGKQVQFKNISEDIQNIINSTNNDKINWEDYSEQLIGGWVAVSKYSEAKRKGIFEKLNTIIDNNIFISENSEKLNKILKNSLTPGQNWEIEFNDLIKNIKNKEEKDLMIKNFGILYWSNKIRITSESIDIQNIKRLPSVFSSCDIKFSILKNTIISNNLDFLELLIMKNPDFLRYNCENGWTSLHFASNTGRFKSVKLLLNTAKELYKDKPEEFKKFINSKDIYDSTPLHGATDQAEIKNKKYFDGVDYMDYTEVVKLLLEHDACIDIVDNNENTPLHLAAMGGYKEVVQLIINKAKELYSDDKKFENFINKKNKDNNTSLDFAKKYKHTEIVKLLEDIDLSNYYNTFNGLKNIFKKPKNITSNSKIYFDKQVNTNNVKSQNITVTTQYKKNKSNFGGFKGGFLNKSSKSENNSNTNAYVDKYFGTNGKQQNYNQRQQNIMYDVPPDNSCLFWSVATAYLLSVRNNNEEFKNRFIQLFGEENLKYLQHIQKLLQQYNLEKNRNNLNQLWYQDQTAINLVTNAFRNRVVDYIGDNLDAIPNHNGEITLRNLIQENNEIANNYLERMREPSTWGGIPEIIAIINILNANISVNNDAPYQPINQNSTDIINIFHVNNGTHYNFALLENVKVNNTNSQEKTTTVKNQQKLIETGQPKTNITISNKSTGSNNNNVPVPSANKPININIANSQKTTIKKAVNKYNSLSKEEKQKKLNEINQHYQSLPENEQKAFKDKLRDVGLGLTSTGISGAGILGISKMTGISPIKGLSTTANYIKNILSTTRTVVSSETGEAVEMTPLLSESTVAEGGLTAAETLSVTEGSVVVATEGTAVIGTEAGTAAALAPETLGLSLVIGGLVIAGTAILWWINSDHTIVKHESHNQYNEIEKYYKFLTHDQLKLDITINKWDKIKQIYQENSNNYQEFKNKIKSEITNFHKENHSGWGGSITDDDINILIKIIYNHFQEINNHFSSNSNHGWKIITNTIGSYFIIDEE